MKVCLIGYGRLAHKLYHALRDEAVVTQIFNRTLSRLNPIQDEVNITDKYQDLDYADLYLICVKDDAIKSVSDQLYTHIPSDSLVAHTSGSQPSIILNKHKNFGFFYPLQSFSYDVNIDFSETPIYANTNNDDKIELLHLLAQSLKSRIKKIDQKQKVGLHLAAVYANNFSNYMYHLAYQICQSEQLEFRDLLPIINQGSAKLKYLTPHEAQTGPALRADLDSINRHLEILKAYNPEWKEIYKICSQGINPSLTFDQSEETTS